jgi:hypothetical protein
VVLPTVNHVSPIFQTLTDEYWYFRFYVLYVTRDSNSYQVKRNRHCSTHHVDLNEVAHTAFKGPSMVKEICIGLTLGLMAGGLWIMHHSGMSSAALAPSIAYFRKVRSV